jgi:chromatin remodeling complex protein RSC6
VQNPENRRQILADNKLEVVFGKKVRSPNERGGPARAA